MGYRKFKGTDIFDGKEFVGAENILLCDSNGVVEALLPAEKAGEDIETLEGILCPGFVNAHCHIELSHLKNAIAPHTGLVNFVQEIIFKRSATTEAKEEAMQQAEAELYATGTVAVADICNTADSILLKQGSKLHWHNFVEVSGFVNNAAATRMAVAERVKEEFDAGLPQCKNVIVPHAPYSVGRQLFSLINAATAGKMISIHNQECTAENELYVNKTGDFLNLYKALQIDTEGFEPTHKTSLQSWLPYFTNGQKIISVHNTFTSEEDLVWLSRKGYKDNLSFCLCPNANLYIENTYPPVELIQKYAGNIVLGTDSLASNYGLNMFKEIQVIQSKFPGIAMSRILRWATLNGAIALGIDDKFGSFEKGKKPGVVLLGNGHAKRIL